MTARTIAYIVVGLFCAEILLLLRSFVFRDRWRPSKKIDLKELRRIDIEYGQKQDPDERFKRWVTEFRAMHERIRFIDHQGKKILLVDFSNRPANEVEKIARAVPDHVTVNPRGSVLVLTDFTGAAVPRQNIVHPQNE
jgi:hypothetical protein